jgi:ABC-type uncharacterized transport system substrate-binding protein
LGAYEAPPAFAWNGIMMMCRLTLKRLGLISLVLSLYAVTGCARRVPAPPPPPIASKPNVTQPVVREAAILYSSASGYVEIASQLKSLLPAEAYRVTSVDVLDPNSRRTLDTLRRRPAIFTVAIGLPAARFARDELKGPVLFAEVFNYKELMVTGRPVRGVAAMPPLELQLQDWKKLDPKVRRVGLIVSQSHSDLIPQAELAAKAAAVTIRPEVSGSDRETLYLFKRLAPQIDGLWLMPDDRIISPAVLRELLEYAVSHRVRVCVFSDALLDWGAFMSVSSTSTDTARTLRRVLETMMAGRASAVPPITPTSELVVRINTQVARRLGLSSPRTSWVVHGGK